MPKELQSFPGSLNYYHRFIPDFAVYATTLYALTEQDFESCDASQEAQRQKKWRHAICAFEALKVKLAETRMLKHFDPQREPIVVVYASEWSVAAVLAQLHDDVCMPVKFTSLGDCVASRRGIYIGIDIFGFIKN
ncbi:unnamed protein product [Phytophthora fragariaefolia]|uniref:Unnamed protein product n=1 Tax=Phytophthora fragariaefolia TaxID=1490495 RepID=A0A9W6TKJ8_9STRA|nr:unnamed protein product [Phytophthora fragariaefolia]